MNKSAKGTRNEHKSRDLLKAIGYPIVIRSRGSFGDWDLVALARYRPTIFVQVKSNRKPPKIQDPELYEPDWVLRFHVWKDYAKEPDIYDARTGHLISPGESR